MTKNWAIAVLALALSGCGDSDSKSVNTNEAGVAIADGSYKVGSVAFEQTDAQQKTNTQAIQTTGTFVWSSKSIGDNQYEMTATGTANFLLNNQVVSTVNCNAGRDVYRFSTDASGAVKNLTKIEGNCNPGLDLNPAYTMTARGIDKNAFVFTIVSQGDGVRTVIAYTLTK